MVPILAAKYAVNKVTTRRVPRSRPDIPAAAEIEENRSFDRQAGRLLASSSRKDPPDPCPNPAEKCNISIIMSEEKESSVLFNLRELMNLEEDRVREEEAERLRSEAAERERIAEEARRTQEEQEARLRAEEEARSAEERRIREDEERLLREREEAELRVRLEQEAREKADEHQRMLAHEKEIAAISAQQRKGVHPGLLAAAAMLVFAAFGGAYFGIYRPAVEQQEAEALEAKMEAERAAREAEEARRAAELEAQKRAEAEAEKARLAEKAQREAQAAAAARRAASPSKPAGKRRGRSKPRKADTDDPLAGLDSL